ncbi:Transcription initiation factor TFIID subunit 3 [Neolecta irregularis DAH-3]|uniref:Transcription initiation factor TFIID subunit 3 n=1 Tax=Neolecta irregularis (strain DAH-3) TaxID=1198029 RepID=A0A1U7LRR3_NEOID|nr:Transcription initiation factor TFIID subunit 3 [Neolecta irregularis DAH-3]|eukprot:OLL25347.1 Transcription initiation factor TFIID subunit 3 [Neolecta irregularis DAH-3]
MIILRKEFAKLVSEGQKKEYPRSTLLRMKSTLSGLIWRMVTCGPWESFTSMRKVTLFHVTVYVYVMKDDRLFFSLCRISATQILQSSGFDKSRPSVIDTFTDILIRYIDLLGSTAKTFAEVAGRSSVHLEDLRGAFENTGVFFKEEGVEEFILWCKGGAVQEARRVSGVGSRDTRDWLSSGCAWQQN